MLIKNIEQYSSIYGKIDAILIVNKDNIIEYSAIMNENNTYLKTENLIGKNLFDVYSNLNEENSTHARVMRTGQPVINEKQLIIERTGRTYTINTCTFPLESKGELIGTLDISFNLIVNGKERGIEKDKDELYTVDDIVTKNAEMNKLKEKIMKIAKTDSGVMVIGESGTGKELVVEAIHSASLRKNKPFIALNCAAVPDSLMESTLFGTVKGSFTGAENRKGIFELANGGTLFLDEINSMNIDLQTKLLKVVEEQKYLKIGGERYVHVDVRIVSAMNINPVEAIRSNKLRKDLFFRLGVIQLKLPPLRERKEDIDILIEYYIRYFNNKMNKDVKGFHELVVKTFRDYYWPGNVRELRNVIEYSFNLVEGSLVRMMDIPEYLISYNYINVEDNLVSTEKGLKDLVEDYEKKVIMKTLKEVKSLSEAAKILKITRQSVKYKVDKYGIDYEKIKKDREV